MDHRLIFWGLALACLGYALLRGGSPERLGALIMIAGVALTITLARSYSQRFHSPETGILIADVATFVAFAALALIADRFWTLWMTGFQGVSVLVHFAMAGAPDIFPSAYAFGLAIWSYPMLILFAVGTHRHRQRMVRSGADGSWSNFSRD